MRTHLRPFFVAALIGAAGLLSACGDKAPNPEEDGNKVESKWTFDEVYAIFEARCVKCHSGKGDGSGASGGLTLTPKAEAYANLINKPAAGGKCKNPGEGNDPYVRVKPEDPEGSLLLQKVKGTHGCGDRMPPAGAPTLTAEQIQTIEAWIENGALNPP
ncbi:c-type cytochrome [Pendulispora brunnea]|uniref:C-type cytochrome n=1 Tax=Pendulispora brunnea TaxID=2905690 RepID=A0ABZ2KBJ6_9BACT